MQPSHGLEAQCVQNSGISLEGVQLLFWLLPTMYLEDGGYWWYLLQRLTWGPTSQVHLEQAGMWD